MGLDFTLLAQEIKDKQVYLIHVENINGAWDFGLWSKNKMNMTRQYATLISKHEISQEISLKTILEFLPKEGIIFDSRTPAIKSILKEMKLCQ